MATSKEYIEFVCEQLDGIENVTYRKMFGECMVYVNAKPLLIVCDNTVMVKKSAGACLSYGRRARRHSL